MHSIMVVKTAAEQRAPVVGRQCALRDTSSAMDQLTEQLRIARIELAEAQREYASKIQAARDHFDEETSAMRRQLSEAMEALNDLRASLFASVTRREGDKLN
jgi:hypothetical protein